MLTRRRGSPWTGVGTVVAKETADHLSGILIVLVEVLVFLAALFAIYTAIQAIRAAIGESRFLFLLLMTVAQPPLPFSFMDLLGMLVPVFAIVLGFDAVNGEFNRRTMSRVLAQPIYRDALLLGKFLSGLLTLTIAFVSLWLLVIGLGLLFLGVPPSTEEALRMFGFLVATILYGGVWLAVAMLFSVVFRAPTTAVLAALGLWLVFLLFWEVITPIAATAIAGPPETILGPNLHYLELHQALSRISPSTLYGQTALALLQPDTRATGILLYTRGMLLGTPLPVGQSFLLVWPQFTGLIAGMMVIFAIAYIAFQRQEIRA
ncbi:MAG: ABC transporter permease [Alphaproteobacteria bacterium]|nr:ABC transporter permease [Alphaproteobacteria bacterium]